MPKLSFRIQADYDKVQRLREEISKLKQEIEGTDASPKAIEELNAKLRGATLELNAIIDKMAKADAKLMESAARIDKAVDAITKAQEKASKSTVGNAYTSTTKAQVAAVEGQAKAYLDLKDEIDSVLGTREQNIRQMVQEQNAIRLINAEIAQINKSRQYGGGLTATQSQRLQQLNDSLLTHKQALAEVRQELNNNAKLDIAAVGSMNELSQSLSRMRIAYRALNEDERNSQFGQNLLKSIQEADARIKELDATIGNHQRNVGNYQGRFNGLNMSVQQIVRELPSATMGINMFFMAISNNLPVMADQIKMAKEFNKEMKAAGSEPVPVWKQLVSSIFSWQTAMMVGITLLTVYGKDIIKWVGNLFKANDAQEQARKEAEAFANTIKKSHEDWRNSMAQTAAQQITSYRKMQREWNALGNNLNEKKKYVDANKTAFHQLGFAVNGVSDAERVMVGNTDAVVASIMARAKAAAYQAEIQEANAEHIRQTDYNKGTVKGGGYYKKFKPENGQITDVSIIKGLVEGKDYTKQMSGTGAYAQLVYTLTASGIAKENKRRSQESAKKLAENQKKADAQLKKRLKFLQGGLESVTKENQDLLKKIGVSEYKDYKETNSPKNGKTEKVGKEVDYDKIVREQSDAERELEEKASQSRINAMQESYEKEKAQRELNHKKELEDLEKYKRDFLQKKIDDAKVIFEADPKNKGKKFNSSIVTLSEDEQAKFDKIHADTLTKQANEDKDYQRQQIIALNDYLKEYGSIQEKRLAIAKEYDEKIALAQSDGEHLSLQAQKAKALADFDINSQKQSMNWEDVFGNLDTFTKAQLENIKSQLRDMLSSNDMDLEGYKTAVDQIDRVNDAILAAEDKQKSFLGMSVTYGETRRKLEMDVTDALQRQADLQEQLGSAQAGVSLNRFAVGQTLQRAGISYNQRDITTANRGDILQKVGDKYGVDSAKYKEVQAALDKLAQSERDYNNVLQKKSKADQDAQSKQSKLNKYLDDFAAKLADLMPLFAQINDNIQDIPGLLSTLGVSEDSSLGKGAAALADGANSTMSAMQDYLSGNYVGAAMNGIKAIGSYVQSATNLFAGAGNEKAMEAEIERLSKANESLSTAIDNLAEKISDSDNTNEQSVEAYKQAKKDEEEWEDNQRKAINDRASEYTNSGHGFLGMGGKGSFNKHAKGSGWSGWYDFNAVLENIGSTARVRNIQDFWKLSPEDMKELQTSANAAWRALFDNDGYKSPEDLVNEYIERAGKLDELTDSLNEKITGYSWDSFKDGYLSMLEDLESSTADFADDINEKINNAILSALVNSEFKDKIEAIYKEISDAAADDNLTEDEINSIKRKNEELASDMLKRRNDYVEMGLITPQTSSQKATANGVTEITYEQANNIVALTTAGNISREQIKDRLTLMNATMDDIRALMNQSPTSASYASDTRQIINNSYAPQIQVSFPKEELQDIKHDVRELRGIVDEMRTHGADRLLIQQQITGDIARIAKNGMEIKSYVLDIKKDTKNLQ